MKIRNGTKLASQLKKELEAVGINLQLQKSRARTTAFYNDKTLYSYILQYSTMSAEDKAVALTSPDPIYRIISQRILNEN